MTFLLINDILENRKGIIQEPERRPSVQYTVKLIRAEGAAPDLLSEHAGQWIQALAKEFGRPIAMAPVTPIEEGFSKKLTLHLMVLFEGRD